MLSSFINSNIFFILISFTVASSPENRINKADSIALKDLNSTELASSSTSFQTVAQSENGQISSEYLL